MATVDAVQLPWAQVGEFLTLSEILTMRLVSHDVINAIHEISPQKCGALLEEALQQRNMQLVPFGSWDRPIQSQEDISNMFIRDGHEYTTTLDGMLRCFRVL